MVDKRTDVCYYLNGGKGMDIQEMRKRKRALGLTNEDLARLSGVPLGTVQKVIGGTTKAPRRETLIALERVLMKADTAESAAYDIQTAGVASYVRESSLAVDYGAVKGGPESDTKQKKKQGEYTIEDYLAWPEDERIELINGRIYMMSAPEVIHQVIDVHLGQKIANYIDDKGGDCIPLTAPVDVQLDCDDRTMVQPDVLILCDLKKLNRKRIVGAPDFVLEILSPSTRAKDIVVKTEKYMSAGCREYWIVDPEGETVTVYDFENENFPIHYSFDDVVPVNIYGGDLTIDFKILRGKLKKFFS